MRYNGKFLRKLIACVALTGLCSLTVSAAIFDRAAVLSPAKLQKIAFTAVKGSDIALSAGDIEARLGAGEGALTGLTFTQLPDTGQAILLVSGKPAEEYVPLSREQVDKLTIVPAEGASAIQFSLIPNCGKVNGNETNVTVNVLDGYNAAPTAQSGTLYTTEDIAASGRIAAYDPEQDTVSVRVIQGPDKGVVTFDGLGYTYEPFPGESGRDSFTFVCEDQYGNPSEESFVDIRIERAGTGFYYLDMNNNPSHYAAVKLSEKGVLTGDHIGGGYFFSPSKTVTRGELLLLLLAATGKSNNVPPNVNTGLDNDATIPMYLKPYVALGMKEGIILEKAFYPDEIPMRAEAVILVRRASKIPYVKEHTLSVADLAEIPDWALGSYMTLDAYKMLDLYDNNRAKPTAALTRDACADLIWQLWKYNDSVVK